MHIYLQSMVKTNVRFQKNRNKIVGGVAHNVHTCIPIGGGRTEGRKPENYVPPFFFEKAALHFSSKSRGPKLGLVKYIRFFT